MKTRIDDLASMALFAEVVRARSFSEAGRRVGLAKSAVSKRIADLERRLAVRLLVRTTRKLSLTEDGVRYYEGCAALVAAADAAEDAVSGASREPRGRVTVNAPATLAQDHLAAPLAAFCARYPEIEVDVRTDNRQVDLVTGGQDLVLRVARIRETSFVARKLAEDRLVICGAPEYLDRRGTPRTPDDLVRHLCLHYALVPRAAEWRFGPGRGLAVPTAGNFTTDDGTLLRAVVTAGLGLAVAPAFVFAREVRAGRLRHVLEAFPGARAGIYALYARRELPARTRLLLDHLARHFARPDWAG